VFVHAVKLCKRLIVEGSDRHVERGRQHRAEAKRVGVSAQISPGADNAMHVEAFIVRKAGSI